jgi:hypothetical protein
MITERIDNHGVSLHMLPIAGELQVRVAKVTPVSIHGDLYYECLLQTREQESAQQASKVRLASHACAGLPEGTPAVGDVLAVGFLMQQATSVRLIARGDHSSQSAAQG